MTRHFRYIPLALVDAAMRHGWSPTLALQGTPHGHHAVMCEWLCDCTEAWPLDPHEATKFDQVAV